jgi:hypothetical protein
MDESPQTFEGFPCKPEKMTEDEMDGGANIEARAVTRQTTETSR